mmetsp:Transcript_16109/g.16239  ORF Transcript_16109/g.16239 Transcript_16109/m.16239 type:complete len:214 (-) Transcript_16109:114-755(-)
MNGMVLRSEKADNATREEILESENSILLAKIKRLEAQLCEKNEQILDDFVKTLSLDLSSCKLMRIYGEALTNKCGAEQTAMASACLSTIHPSYWKITILDMKGRQFYSGLTGDSTPTDHIVNDPSSPKIICFGRYSCSSSNNSLLCSNGSYCLFMYDPSVHTLKAFSSHSGNTVTVQDIPPEEYRIFVHFPSSEMSVNVSFVTEAEKAIINKK